MPPHRRKTTLDVRNEIKLWRNARNDVEQPWDVREDYKLWNIVRDDVQLCDRTKSRKNTAETSAKT